MYLRKKVAGVYYFATVRHFETRRWVCKSLCGLGRSPPVDSVIVSLLETAIGKPRTLAGVMFHTKIAHFNIWTPHKLLHTRYAPGFHNPLLHRSPRRSIILSTLAAWCRQIHFGIVRKFHQHTSKCDPACRLGDVKKPMETCVP